MRACDAHAHEAVTHLHAQLDAGGRQAAETDNRLTADLEEAHAKGRVFQGRLEDATAGAQRLRTELDAGLNRDDALVVDAARAPRETAAALRCGEGAEARVTALEIDFIRREADAQVLRAHDLLRRLFFRLHGRPVKPLRRLLFDTSGPPRRILRVRVLHKNGARRSAFAPWMGSREYLSSSCGGDIRSQSETTPQWGYDSLFDPHDELAITTKVKTTEPTWSLMTRCKSISSVGTAWRNLRSRNCKRRDGGRLGVFGPHTSSKAFSLRLPSSPT
jgi:hypothetical protein